MDCTTSDREKSPSWDFKDQDSVSSTPTTDSSQPLSEGVITPATLLDEDLMSTLTVDPPQPLSELSIPRTTLLDEFAIFPFPPYHKIAIEPQSDETNVDQPAKHQAFQSQDMRGELTQLGFALLGKREAEDFSEFSAKKKKKPRLTTTRRLKGLGLPSSRPSNHGGLRNFDGAKMIRDISPPKNLNLSNWEDVINWLSTLGIQNKGRAKSQGNMLKLAIRSIGGAEFDISTFMWRLPDTGLKSHLYHVQVYGQFSFNIQRLGPS
jgi:hypothetical protein